MDELDCGPGIEIPTPQWTGKPSMPCGAVMSASLASKSHLICVESSPGLRSITKTPFITSEPAQSEAEDFSETNSNFQKSVNSRMHACNPPLASAKNM